MKQRNPSAIANVRCRRCLRAYDPFKSRADWKGYCSAKCQHEMARELGYRPPRRYESHLDQARAGTSEYCILNNARLIGEWGGK